MVSVDQAAVSSTVIGGVQGGPRGWLGSWVWGSAAHRPTCPDSVLPAAAETEAARWPANPSAGVRPDGRSRWIGRTRHQGWTTARQHALTVREAIRVRGGLSMDKREAVHGSDRRQEIARS